MAIKSNVSIPITDVLTTDTTVLNPIAPIERLVCTAMSLHNTSASLNTTVTLYSSPNLTSASGKEVAVYSIGPLSSVDVNEIIGQGYPVGRNIIAKSNNLGVNIMSTVTTYDGGS